MSAYVPRLIDGLLSELLAEFPAILVVGARAVGKTTAAARQCAAIARLDTPAEAFAFEADPDAALRDAPAPLLLDEWHSVPHVLGAVKRAVDRDPRPGRYVLTGSVQADIEGQAWPGTGRLLRLPMYGMTMREQLQIEMGVPFLERVARRELELPDDIPDLRDYVDLALRSGFPDAALHEGAARRRWLESYAEQIVTRDLRQVGAERDPTRLRRFLEAYALSSAGTVTDTTLLDASGINRRTALAYQRLLSDLFMIDEIPAWTSNRLKRLVLSPKRYLVEPAMIPTLLRMDGQAVLRDGDVLGRLLDTFVTAQIRAELPLSSPQPRLFHLRTKEGRHEIDLLAELSGRRLVGVEVKAHAGPDSSSARHLAWLRDRIGDRFVGGVVLHTGSRIYPLGERIVAAPICTLWG